MADVETPIEQTEEATQDSTQEEADWGEDISPEGNRRLFKKILQEGEGDEYPQKGNEVYVHYTGRLLDGTVFDSSVDRNELFNFKLGEGKVIKGWDVGVATMRKGEKCLLTCRPDFAYGEQGAGDKIPPNSTLQFEVELFRWQGEDITGDNGVIMYVVKEGKDFRKPTEGSSVKVHMKGTVGTGTDGAVIEDREVEFDLGEGSECSVIEGVETAISHMKAEEEVKLVIQPQYAFGSTGDDSKGVPADSVVTYRVTLLSFVKVKGSYEYDDVQEKIKDSTALKEKGTNYFKAAKFSLAQKIYKRGLDLVDNDSGSDKDESKTIRILLLLNIAACQLKLGDEIEARDNCDKVLEEDPTNVKAHFRRGQALQMMQDYKEAIQCYQAALKEDARNRSAQQQIQICRQKMKQQLEKDKKLYANMFKVTSDNRKKAPVKDEGGGAQEEPPQVNGDSKDDNSPVKDAIAEAAEEQTQQQEIAMET